MDTATTIIGAGVVGLSVAAELAEAGGPVLLLEKHDKFGQETSSYNSEVIHAGLYYPPGSLKARLCVQGNRMLRESGAEGRVPVKVLTKLVAGQDEDEQSVLTLFERARANGVEGIRIMGRAEIQRIEPNLSSSVALFSSSTGVLDSHELMRYVLAIAADRGVDVAFQTEVVGISRIEGGYRVKTRDSGGDVFEVDTERVVNAAGLWADRVAAMAGIDVDEAGYRLHWCKGDYYSTASRCWKLVSRLVYPVPGERAVGLGIHVTLDLGGRMRLGPDATYLEPGQSVSNAADPTKRRKFGEAVRRFLPAVRDEDLEPEFAGIRPKLQGPGDSFRDFVIAEETGRGLPGFVNLIGIDSPGLTASPAIAREVRRLLEG